jgi:hypothetical protein
LSMVGWMYCSVTNSIMEREQVSMTSFFTIQRARKRLLHQAQQAWHSRSQQCGLMEAGRQGGTTGRHPRQESREGQGRPATSKQNT